MCFSIAPLDLRSVAKLSNSAFINCSLLIIKRDKENALYNSSLTF